MFVFFDGTANDPDSATNIWKLYQMIKSDSKKSTDVIYIEGFGTRDKPLTGMALGSGMDERILMGYKYLTEKYRLGDNIYILGFSRGSHQARALAGFISYAGLPKLKELDDYDLMKLGNKVIEITKDKNDRDYHQLWVSWVQGNEPMLKEEIQRELNIETQPVTIKFLGVWDTVPGSSLKKFGVCKEKVDRKDGDRYKSDSYPTINYIAHAVSIDEKRTKFAPILICNAINPKYTEINEVWFPGAHADVGGGYDDEISLSGISLNWMLENLSKKYIFKNSIDSISGNFKGRAHWSIGDRPANIGSKCKDRVLPQNAKIHQTYNKRKTAELVPIRIKGTVYKKKYPILCSEVDSAQD